MNSYRNIYFFLIITACIFLFSCSAKNLLTMSVTEPAPVTINSSISKVGIINRSEPSEQTKILDKIDKVLSAEGKNLDKDGAKKATRALFEELQKNTRFESIKIIENEDVAHNALSVFPVPLSWDQIDQFCKKYDVDAIFTLAYYDTDTKADLKAVPVEIEGPLGIKAPAVESHATINTLVKTGWRIYDPVNKYIADEYWANDNVILTGKGLNPMKAAQAIMGRKDAVLTLSDKLGRNYAYRILPYRIRVSRYYFVRGTDNFKIAKRRAQTGDWNGAAELWAKETDHPKRKVAGRACYNMAIINEINGDLDQATEWASRSYTDYKNKLALRYLNTLRHRIDKNKRLQQQTQ